MVVAVLDVPRLPPDWAERVAAVRAADRVDLYVLRAKTLPARDQWRWAMAVKPLLAGRPWLVADRVDVAEAAAATGVHLPEDGLPVAVARRLWPGAMVSRAIHAPPAADDPPDDPPDWWLFGHLFPSRSKPGLTPRGLEVALEVKRRVSRPVVGIGGITAERARAVKAAGLDGIAVVDALWQAEDSAAAARALRTAWDDG
jgi:thiazole tautomerase (transcriptional regulator TenI)